MLQTIILTTLICIIPTFVNAEMIAGYDINKWADAIYKAENSKTYPYGIMVSKRLDAPTARKYCLNTVRNNYKRYRSKSIQQPGLKEPFIKFLAKRYCPPEPDQTNWIKNVAFFLKKDNALPSLNRKT
jgi:hypothetical protein